MYPETFEEEVKQGKRERERHGEFWIVVLHASLARLLTNFFSVSPSSSSSSLSLAIFLPSPAVE